MSSPRTPSSSGRENRHRVSSTRKSGSRPSTPAVPMEEVVLQPGPAVNSPARNLSATPLQTPNGKRAVKPIPKKKDRNPVPRTATPPPVLKQPNQTSPSLRFYTPPPPTTPTPFKPPKSSFREPSPSPQSPRPISTPRRVARHLKPPAEDDTQTTNSQSPHAHPPKTPLSHPPSAKPTPSFDNLTARFSRLEMGGTPPPPLSHPGPFAFPTLTKGEEKPTPSPDEPCVLMARYGACLRNDACLYATSHAWPRVVLVSRAYCTAFLIGEHCQRIGCRLLHQEVKVDNVAIGIPEKGISTPKLSPKPTPTSSTTKPVPTPPTHPAPHPTSPPSPSLTPSRAPLFGKSPSTSPLAFNFKLDRSQYDIQQRASAALATAQARVESQLHEARLGAAKLEAENTSLRDKVVKMEGKVKKLDEYEERMRGKRSVATWTGEDPESVKIPLRAPPVVNHTAQATEAHKSGDYANAVNLYTRVLDPTSKADKVILLGNRASAYYKLGMEKPKENPQAFDLALKDCSTVSELTGASGYFKTLLLEAQIHVALKNVSSALRLCRLASSTSRSDADRVKVAVVSKAAWDLQLIQERAESARKRADAKAKKDAAEMEKRLREFRNMTDWQILDLAPTFVMNHAKIKAAYQKAALKYHPDKPGGHTELFQRVNKAYEKLSAQCRR